ncbi:hypothetical protein KUTeg_024547 [Tegillarca granosa]|uniref:Uncharacterized protein n=1 Tax=Tegillarca granosa TaxID=220873 RepID=A0ABQ9E2R9_TEGGR|nr:hypothetical protein KUTeg_024547 [Tegillarca granosa]
MSCPYSLDYLKKNPKLKFKFLFSYKMDFYPIMNKNKCKYFSSFISFSINKCIHGYYIKKNIKRRNNIYKRNRKKNLFLFFFFFFLLNIYLYLVLIITLYNIKKKKDVLVNLFSTSSCIYFKFFSVYL